MHSFFGDLTFADGTTGPLSRLYAERPLGLVFLRHLGCVFCRRMVSLLSRRPDWNVCLVLMAEPETAQRFLESLDVPFPAVCDPQARLYDKMGLGVANLRGIFSPRVVREGFAAWGEGHRAGRPVGDPWRLGGAFVIATDGSIAWSYRSKDAADNPPIEGLGSALGESTAV